jgi:hypothetical protein
MDETEATAGPNSLLRLAFAPEGEHKSTCANALLRALFRTMKYVTAASDRGHAKIRRYREAPRGPTWGSKLKGKRRVSYRCINDRKVRRQPLFPTEQRAHVGYRQSTWAAQQRYLGDQRPVVNGDWTLTSVLVRKY